MLSSNIFSSLGDLLLSVLVLFLLRGFLLLHEKAHSLYWTWEFHTWICLVCNLFTKQCHPLIYFEQFLFMMLMQNLMMNWPWCRLSCTFSATLSGNCVLATSRFDPFAQHPSQQIQLHSPSQKIQIQYPSQEIQIQYPSHKYSPGLNKFKYKCSTIILWLFPPLSSSLSWNFIVIGLSGNFSKWANAASFQEQYVCRTINTNRVFIFQLLIAM